MKTLKVLLLAAIFVSLSQVANAQIVTHAPQLNDAVLFYNINTNSIKLMTIEESNNYSYIKYTIYNYNGSIWKSFTLTPPNGYDYISYTIQLSQDFHGYIYATDDYFNDDDLVEVVVRAWKDGIPYGDYREYPTFMMNENNQVVVDFDALGLDAYYFRGFFPAKTGGFFYFRSKYNGDIYILDLNDTSGINTVAADNNSGSVSPNPSNGAASVEVSWDYTLLDDAQLNVVDMDGKLVHTQAIKSGNRKTNLSTSRFSTGTYIYIVHGSNGYTSTGKFVIN